MADGIKESKVGIAGLKYNIGADELPGGGLEEYDDYYLMGIGEDTLVYASHEPAYVDELTYDVDVYLESDTAALQNKHIGNKMYVPDSEGKLLANSEGTIYDPIEKISENEFDDLGLYAKWYQTIFKRNTEFNDVNDQGYVYLKENDVIFTGKE